MIPNPQNVFESLQNDVAAQLLATAPFNAITLPDGSPFNVLTQDEGDTQFLFDAQIAQLGLMIMVKRPAGTVDQPDIPGPLITKLNFEVWVTEAPEFNKVPYGATSGTGIRVMQAAAIVMGTLHGFQPASIGSPVYMQGYRNEEARTFIANRDSRPDLITSIVITFIAPQVAATIVDVAPPSPGGPTTPFEVTDNFDRADGGLGSNWAFPITATESQLSIIGGQVGQTTDNTHAYAFWNDQFTDNQWSQIVLQNIGTFSGVILRADADMDRFYLVIIFAGNVRIYARWDGGYSLLAQDTVVTWTANDFLKAEIIGSAHPITVTASRNGSPILSWTSSSIAQVRTGGSPGLVIYKNTGENLRLDNFTAGNTT